MTDGDALPSEVVEAAVNVCGRAFHLKAPLKQLMVSQGLPTFIWDRYATPEANKFGIARNVFGDLTAQGLVGRTVLRKIVTELANLTRPHNSVDQPAAGIAAIAELRELAVTRRLLQDPDAVRRDERQRAQERAARTRLDRASRRNELHGRVSQLHRLSDSPQQRGYELERILAELFALNEMTYRPSYRSAHEQVDGAFEHEGFHYLVEARWRTMRPDVGDLADFKFKVDSKLESTRGVLVSMTGFDEEIVEHFMASARGSRNNLILFDGQDLTMILEGAMELREALDYKIGKAAQEGQWWAPLARRF